jgi:hypothetical protein
VPHTNLLTSTASQKFNPSATTQQHTALFVQTKARDATLHHCLAHEWKLQRQKWGPDELVSYFEACLHTRNAEGLSRICQILSEVSNHHKGFTESVGHVPHKSTLKRLCLQIDLALMLLEQDRSSAPLSHCRYMLLDSSPQGNRDWLLSRATVVPRSSLIEMQGAADALLQLKEAKEIVPGSHQKLVQVLRNNMRYHTYPPAAIGLAQANVAHKCAALLHSMMLETRPGSATNGRPTLSALLQSIISVTGDLGVEIGIPGFQAPLTDLLPSWRQQWLQELLPEMAEGPGTTAELVADDTCFLEAVTCPEAVTSTPQVQESLYDAQVPMNAKTVMPFALPIPGMLHVCHNLLNDADVSMTNWEPFWAQLNNLAALLCNQQRLNRFCAKCVPDGHLKEYFLQKLDRPYTKRPLMLLFMCLGIFCIFV